MLLPEYIKRELPKLFATRDRKDPMVYCKFYDPVGVSTWFVIEGEEQSSGDFLFFGYIIGKKNGLGYFTLFQLIRMKDGMWNRLGLPIERDVYFKRCRLSKVLVK